MGTWESMGFKLQKELVGILWEKAKAYYCNCRKLVSNPQDAEIAAGSWAEQGDPKIQPAPDGTFPDVLCKRDTGSATATWGGKPNQPPKMKDERSPGFWHHLLGVGRTPVKPLGLPRGTLGSPPALLWCRHRTELGQRGAKCS